MTDVTARDIVVVAVLGVVLGGGLGAALGFVVQHFVTEHGVRSEPARPRGRPLLRDMRGMRYRVLDGSAVEEPPLPPDLDSLPLDPETTP